MTKGGSAERTYQLGSVDVSAVHVRVESCQWYIAECQTMVANCKPMNAKRMWRNCKLLNARRRLLKSCFTSTETVGLLETGAQSRTSTSTVTQLQSSADEWQQTENARCHFVFGKE